MMIFFASFICYLDLALDGWMAGWLWIWSSLFHSVCECVRAWVFIVQCIWHHFVQLVMVPWFILGQYQVGHILINIFMAFHSFKNSMNFFCSCLKPIKCTKWFIVYLAWIHTAVFIRFFFEIFSGGIAWIAYAHTKYTALFYCFSFSFSLLIFFGRSPQRDYYFYLLLRVCVSNWSLLQQCLMQWKYKFKIDIHFISSNHPRENEWIPFQKRTNFFISNNSNMNI